MINSRQYILFAVLALLSVFCVASPAMSVGIESDSSEIAVSSATQRKAPTLPGLLREAPLPRVQDWLDWKLALKEDHGLDFSVDYNFLYQSATQSPGQSVSAGGVVELYGRWLLVGGDDTSGTFGFSFDNRHKFTDTSPGGFGNQVGSQWPTSDGWGVRQWAWKQWWWEQSFAEKQINVTIGKLNAGSFYEQNRLADADEYFLNYALSDNPAGNQPGEGLGVNLSATLGNLLLSAGMQDANGEATNFGFETIDEKEFFFESQATYAVDWDGLVGKYRAAYWHQPPGKDQGRLPGGGILVGFDQELYSDDAYVAVANVRYGYQGEKLVPTKQFFSVSAALDGMFGSKGNGIGLGGSWGEPSTKGLCDQYVMESFIRFQLTPSLQFTPDVQYIMNPSNAPGVSDVSIVSFRLVLAL